MRRGAPALVCLLLVSACATPGPHPPLGGTARVILREVCLPFAFENASVETVMARAGGGWIRNAPDPFVTASGPSFRRGPPLSDQDRLSFGFAGRQVIATGQRALRSCSLTLRRGVAEDLPALVRAEAAAGPGVENRDPHGQWSVVFCERRNDGTHRYVGALTHPDGRQSLAVGGNAAPTVVCP